MPSNFWPRESVLKRPVRKLLRGELPKPLATLVPRSFHVSRLCGFTVSVGLAHRSPRYYRSTLLSAVWTFLYVHVTERSVTTLPSLDIIAKSVLLLLQKGGETMSDLTLVSNWQEAIFLAGTSVLSRFFVFLPSFFAAIIIFLFGLMLGKWIKALVVKILETVKLDQLLRKAGLDSYLNKADIRGKIEVFFGELVRWLIILVFSMAAVNIIGLTTVSAVLNSLLGYIPNIISAVLVLTVGVLLAGLVESLVKGAVSQVDVRISRMLAKIASYLVVIVSALAAINELGIAQSLINTLFIGVVATLSLGIGLAIGLGAKELVAKMFMDWYGQKKRK